MSLRQQLQQFRNPNEKNAHTIFRFRDERIRQWSEWSMCLSLIRTRTISLVTIGYYCAYDICRLFRRLHSSLQFDAGSLLSVYIIFCCSFVLFGRDFLHYLISLYFHSLHLVSFACQGLGSHIVCTLCTCRCYSTRAISESIESCMWDIVGGKGRRNRKVSDPLSSTAG